jgi:hypothetical protein
VLLVPPPPNLPSCCWLGYVCANILTLPTARDGEEYGLVGSTWYGETFADELSKKAVAYLNVDVGAPHTATPPLP